LPEPAPTDGDALNAVRAHLDDAHAAAERLVQEAQRQAEEAAAQDVPPRGWESSAPGTPPATGGVPDLQALVALLDGLRRAVPPELSRQLAEAVRDLLLAVRAVIDWYLEKLGPGTAPAPPEVEDIPLD
jgi:ATP phosphoribosyltransferase regulatory subunit HisZ